MSRRNGGDFYCACLKVTIIAYRNVCTLEARLKTGLESKHRVKSKEDNLEYC